MIRRLFRILPVYWAAMLMGVVCLIFFGEYCKPIDILLRGMMLSPLLPLAISSGNIPLDNVVVEFWLYIIYAIVLRFKLGSSLSVLIVAGVLLPLFFSVAFDRVWSFTNVLAFLPYWWMVVLVAEIKFDSSNTGVIKVRHLINCDKVVRIVFLAMLLMTFSTVFFDRYSMSGAVIRYMNQYLFSCIVVIILVHGYLSWNSKFLLKIGLTSYSICAFHMPILIWIESVFQSGFLALGEAIVTSVIFASIIYLIFEKPMHLIGKRVTENAI